MATNPITLGASSIDVASIVKNLTDNKRRKPEEALAQKVSANSTKLSATGNFVASLTSLQTAIKGLTDGTAFSTQKTSVSDPAVLSATVEQGTAPNAYNIVVGQLAAGQKTTSSAYADSRTPVGTGTLTFAVGGKNMSVEMKAGANTLENLRDAINKGANNPGVTASIITGSDGAHLVLSSTTTGEANAFSVSASGGDGQLATLAFDPKVDKATVVAQDATFTVDGTAATSATNTVGSAINGVTLTLSKTGPSTVTTANDPGAASAAVQSLVTAYNAFAATYKTLTKYDPVGKQVGALIGDATVTSIKNQMTAVLGAQFSGNSEGPRSLSSIGVAFQLDGTLKLDTAKLTKALSVNPNETRKLFSDPQGIAPKLDKLISSWTSSSGILSQRTANLITKARDLTGRQDDYKLKMDDYAAQLTKRYTKLDTLMTKLSGTSSYLQQQFDALSKSK